VFVCLVLAAGILSLYTARIEGQSGTAASEAPTGFDNQTNGLVNQATHDLDREVFDEQEFVEDGLGPVYNAQSCAECHQNPVSGAGSQITELRAGANTREGFEEHPGGSLIHSRAIDASAQELVFSDFRVRAFRASLNTLGDGFVECIADSTLIQIAQAQPGKSSGLIRGQVIQVPLLEAPNQTRAGRFGWKNQHASLVSFSADAYLNEMGITTPFLVNENTSNGRSVAAYDHVSDPEDDGADVEIFARFMRATKAPPRDAQLAATFAARAGAHIFEQIGCGVCHVSSIVTAPPGTRINGGAFLVPPALGGKVIHPFGDFLLHDIGTGDGIVQNGPPSTANKMRTAPLWGLRTRNRLMHDGLSLTTHDAIMRHGGEAAAVREAYKDLNHDRTEQLLTFLRSL
jgi:CxxC motif-containing protein (DUF1111 family)